MKLVAPKEAEEKKINVFQIIKILFATIIAITTIGLIGYTGIEILQFNVVYHVGDTLFSIAVITFLCILSGGLLSSSFTSVKTKYKVRFGSLIAIFTFYCFLLINLLFTSRHQWIYQLSELTVWERFERNLNLVPFQTISNYIGNAANNEISTILINLVGNFVAFMPMAFFLPVFIKKLQRLRPFAITLLIGIVVIELIQGFTNVGVCDIDDLILNLAGAVTAFFLCKIPFVARLQNWFRYQA